MPFQKGQSGNPGGRTQDKPWREAILRAVKRKEEGDLRALDRLADKLVAEGIAGDVTALKEIGDRLDGRSSQQINHQGAAEGSNLVVEIVKHGAT